MASSKPYLDFILEQLSDLEDIRFRTVMGEFIIYYREKIVGGIYDRLLVKAIPSAIAYMPDVLYELPCEGAKKMLLLKELDDKAFITGLFNAIYDELPEPPRKKKKKNRFLSLPRPLYCPFYQSMSRQN